MIIEWSKMSCIERDAEVSEEVMGRCAHRELWGTPPQDCTCVCGVRVFKETMEDQTWSPRYTTQIARAWEVVIKVWSLGFVTQIAFGAFSTCQMGNAGTGGDDLHISFCERVEEAICMTALKTRGLKIVDGE